MPLVCEADTVKEGINASCKVSPPWAYSIPDTKHDTEGAKTTSSATSQNHEVIGYPADGASLSDNTPDLAWSQSNGNVNYFYVQIATDSGFINLVADVPNWGSFNYTPPALADGAYWWRVKAHDSSGLWSNWSTQSFTISTLPDLTTSAIVASNYTSGQAVQIPVTVNRSGANLTNGTFTDARIYWSANSTWDISSIPYAGGVPLFRFYYPSKMYYYTTTNIATASAGYSEGPTVIGYVSPVPTENLIPMYHLASMPGEHDHFYTMSEFERNNAIAKYNYKDYGIAMYVSRNATNAPLAGRPVAKDSAVDLFSGNFQPFYNNADFANPPGKGIPFVFARTYNVFNTTETSPLGYPLPVGRRCERGD